MTLHDKRQYIGYNMQTDEHEYKYPEKDVKEAVKEFIEEINFGRPKGMDMMISVKEVENILKDKFGEGLIK